MNLTKRYLAELVEQVVKVFVVAYLGAVQLQGVEWDHLFTLKALNAALTAAVGMLLIGIGGKPVGNPNSTSLLPPSLQPPAPVPVDPDPEAPKVVAGVESTGDDYGKAFSHGYREAQRAMPTAEEAVTRARQEGAILAVKALSENNLEVVVGPPGGRHSPKPAQEEESPLAPWMRGR